MTTIYIMTEDKVVTNERPPCLVAVMYTTSKNIIESHVGSTDWTLDGSRYLEGDHAIRQGFAIDVDEEMDGESEIWVALNEYGDVLGAAVEASTLVAKLADSLECGEVRSMHAVGGPSTHEA